MIHRDLTSNNILLDQINQAKLCDFGFSQAQGSSSRPTTPASQESNVMALTYGYAAPEYLATGAATLHGA